MLTHGELMTRQAIVEGFLAELQDAGPFQELWRSALAEGDVAADLRAASEWVQSRERPTSEYALCFLQAFDPLDLAAGPREPNPIEHLARHFASGGCIASSVRTLLSAKGPLAPISSMVVGHLWEEVARDILGSDSPFHGDNLLIAWEARLTDRLEFQLSLPVGTPVSEALRELTTQTETARKRLQGLAKSIRGTIPSKRLELHSDWGRWLVRHYVLEHSRKALAKEVFVGDDRQREITRGISEALRILGLPNDRDQS